MAVETAPAITSTVLSGPIWVITAIPAPAPEMSAAPTWISRMLKVKMKSAVIGTDTAIVGSRATRRMNQHCRMNSFH
jgi:hypothetical protein